MQRVGIIDEQLRQALHPSQLRRQCATFELSGSRHGVLQWKPITKPPASAADLQEDAAQGERPIPVGAPQGLAGKGWAQQFSANLF